MTPILEGQDIEKYFPARASLRLSVGVPRGRRTRVHALERISLRAEPGEIIGIVGPNGAGKTTLLRVLAHVLEPDGGCIWLCGEKMTARAHRLRQQIGYVSSDERSFFWRLTGRQNLIFFASLYCVPRAHIGGRVSALLDRLDLQEKADLPFQSYSSGMRKRLALARALLHGPRLVLLDELTNSLDPLASRNVKRLVREYVSEGSGRAALWSTHRLEEITEMCDRAVVMERGTVRFCGSTCEFAMHGRQTVDALTTGARGGAGGADAETVPGRGDD